MATSSTTGRRDGAARGHLPDHRPRGDPEAPRRRRGHGAGAHHRDPRPHPDPDLRPGDRAADGHHGCVPAAHRSERPQARPRQVRKALHRHDHFGAQYGVRAICGKGGFPDEAIEPMQKHGMVYFAIVGGAAALETTQIEEIEEVAWEELMPECLWKFRVKDFGPLTVGIDAHGNSLYHDVQAAAHKKLEEIYAKL